MYKTFETERLVIRPTQEEDAELIYQLLNSPKFIQYVGDRNIDSIETAKKYIQNNIHTQLKKNGFSSYTLITKESENKIGVCGLYDRSEVDGIDIGFGLLSQFERQGYAHEAAQRVLKGAFEDFGLKEIKAITDNKNSASQRLLEKLGLERKGVTKLPDEDKEILLYVKQNTIQ